MNEGSFYISLLEITLHKQGKLFWMSQDKEAIVVLALGILFCLMIIIASYFTDHSTIQIDGQWNYEGAAIQYGLIQADLGAENKGILPKG
ncbi:MAG: hypothetical protein ACRD8Z_12560 [Nitrososphaeraceae archaeon]